MATKKIDFHIHQGQVFIFPDSLGFCKVHHKIGVLIQCSGLPSKQSFSTSIKGSRSSPQKLFQKPLPGGYVYLLLARMDRLGRLGPLRPRRPRRQTPARPGDEGQGSRSQPRSPWHTQTLKLRPGLLGAFFPSVDLESEEWDSTMEQSTRAVWHVSLEFTYCHKKKTTK